MPKGVYDRKAAKKRKNHRDDIISAAMKTYAHYGFEGATMERMAEAAGVSKALLHAHFGDKQGLVQAIAARAVRDNLEYIRQIDQIPDLTLRLREDRIFTAFKAFRENWCLIYGTLLVPNFQFELRNAIQGYLDEEHTNILRYLQEFKVPTSETALAFAYTMMALRQQYVQDEREEDFLRAQRIQFDFFLLPEEEVMRQRSEK